MTSMQRVLTTLSHKEPDRVPLFLFLSMQGARELKLSLKDYYSKPEYVAQGQFKLVEKFGHDCYYSFYYGPIEVQARGADVIFSDNGPVNSATPFIHAFEDIETLPSIKIKDNPCLSRVLETTRLLKEKAGSDVPVVGVVMSPFSVPVMQMGFDKYLDLIYTRPDLFEKLMAVNEEFCAAWANAQLEAGATAICYFDPVSSTTIIPKELYLKTGFQIAKRTISAIKGPTATHLASGRSIPIAADVAKTGTAIISASSLEDISQMKEACKGKLTVLGNLNGVEMRRWTMAQAEAAVKDTIAKAGHGGGFILSDNHGEIPCQVSDDVLYSISEAVKKWGTYPLTWTKTNG